MAARRCVPARAGSEPAFWGDRLAARHDVVVVTVNHRLGALGYLPLGDGAEDAGHAGMLDIVAALEWVRRNIASFGGDPHNVTVFGQSGGGMKIATLMAMPSARGLFHKAIIQSGAGLWLPSEEEARPLADALFDVLGVQRGDVDALRDTPVDALVQAQFAAMGMTPTMPFGFAPVRDGKAIISQPVDREMTSAPDVPLLIGSTSEEAGMFLATDPSFATLDDAALDERLSGDFGTEAPDVLRAYRRAFPAADAQGLLRRIETDRDLRVSERQFVRAKREHSRAPIFAYLFDYNGGVLDGAVGAAHSADLAFVFDNADRIPLSGTRPERDALARTMAQSWTQFARTGDPSVPGGRVWPRIRRTGARRWSSTPHAAESSATPTVSVWT
ncbi:carboxylesterase family protein [Microbacterium sp. NIBRBAC000506063]|uniref:carboxylesterase family protein n=1 Tax=Microbacterium sp. NIBRBAC000506063 TaxID=2734618 RepID=UPI001BB64D89|nr:carboxylesterase family protein [Microbacterium sp. NIBRBAC000506063]QTV79110.1 carboxylesterase/lipase family protein [Microbacterium sp. NIBRBAC000506063]